MKMKQVQTFGGRNHLASKYSTAQMADQRLGLTYHTE